MAMSDVNAAKKSAVKNAMEMSHPKFICRKSPGRAMKVRPVLPSPVSLMASEKGKNVKRVGRITRLAKISAKLFVRQVMKGVWIGWSLCLA